MREAAVDLVWAWKEIGREGELGLDCFVGKLEDDALEGEFKDMILRVLEWSGNGMAEVMGIQDAFLSAALHDVGSKMLWRNDLESKELRGEASLGQSWAGENGEAMDEDDTSGICNTIEQNDEMEGIQTSFSSEEKPDDKENTPKVSMETDETFSFVRGLTGSPGAKFKREEHSRNTPDLPLQQSSISMNHDGCEHTTTNERTETTEKTIVSEDATTTIYTTTTIRTVTVVVPRDVSSSNKGEKAASNLVTVLAPQRVMRRGGNFSDAEKLWLLEHLHDGRPTKEIT